MRSGMVKTVTTVTLVGCWVQLPYFPAGLPQQLFVLKNGNERGSPDLNLVHWPSGLKKCGGLWAKSTRRLIGNGDKVMAGREWVVLMFLSTLCFIGNGTSLACCQCDVRWSEYIWPCSIPCHNSSTFPWDNGGPSDRLPSDCEVPVGSRCAGIFTAVNDLLIHDESDDPGFCS